MRNDGSLLKVNELGTHKVTKSERVCLQSDAHTYCAHLYFYRFKIVKISEYKN
ncbi:Uncharacterised protein [Staphylococcus petrasii]|nr:Uncharacterised protein [Staphylococcus petrasii]